MPPDSLYFIALLPPEPIQHAVHQIKLGVRDRFASQAALKSPPHITLQPPFSWPMAQRQALDLALSTFAQTQAPVPVTLSGFGAFAPRVIYLRPQPTPELMALQPALMTYLERQLGLLAETRPFVPHLTVGFRDLTPENFHRAWAEFQDQPYEAAFVCDRLTLLRHDGQQWTIDQTFELDEEEIRESFVT